MYNMVPVVGNTVFYKWNLLTVELEFSQKKKVSMWGEDILTWWWEPLCGVHVHKIIMLYTLNAILFANYTSVFFKKNTYYHTNVMKRILDSNISLRLYQFSVFSLRTKDMVISWTKKWNLVICFWNLYLFFPSFSITLSIFISRLYERMYSRVCTWV